MTNRRNPLVPLAAVAAALAALPAAAFDAPLAADAHVSASLASTNFGSLPTLNVGGGAQALLRFDLSGLPAGTTGAKVVKANLRLFVGRVGVPGAIEVVSVNSAWDEATVTAAAALANGGAGSGVTVPVGRGAQFVTADLTSLVRQWVANPAANQGVMLQPALSAPGTVVFVDSKENTTTAHVAQLDITLADQGPQGVPGQQGLPGAKGDKGDKGDRGDVGPQGLQGIQGPQGAQGPRGFQGIQGNTGPAGPVNVTYVRSSTTLPGNNQGSRFASCPIGSVVISGGCGHRDFNTAADDIVVNYTGPDPSNPRRSWRCLLDNTSGDNRAVEAWAICATASTVTGP